MVSPWQTEKRAFVYISSEAYTFDQVKDTYRALVFDETLNLIRNPLVNGSSGWQQWDCEPHWCTLSFDQTNDAFGPPMGSFKVAIMDPPPAKSPCWAQEGLRGRHDTTYLHAAAVKMQRIKGRHSFWGSYADSGYYFISIWGAWGDGAGGDPYSEEWSIKSGLSHSPSPEVTLNVKSNLGMSTSDTTRGTIWYDGVLLAEAFPAQVYTEYIRPLKDEASSPCGREIHWSRSSPMIRIRRGRPA